LNLEKAVFGKFHAQNLHNVCAFWKTFAKLLVAKKTDLLQQKITMQCL
jgi:hypothetical protein